MKLISNRLIDYSALKRLTEALVQRNSDYVSRHRVSLKQAAHRSVLPAADPAVFEEQTSSR